MDPIKVLVVDDSAVMRKLVIRTLGETPYKPAKIVEAGDGNEGLKRFIENADINLILSDWNMPNMDGLTFIKKIREKDKKVVVLMITTEGTLGKMEDALNEGVNGYVVKPFTPQSLAQRLEKALGKP